MDLERSIDFPSDHERDLQLMRRVAEGDECAFETLMRAYWRALVAYCGRVLHETDAAEDIAQETFVRLWQARAAWRPNGSVRAYLYRIARNCAFNERRRLQVRTRAAAVRLAPTPSAGMTPADRVENRELARMVEQAILCLPERRRQIFLLARAHNMTYNEIATALDLSPQTVANQMSAALADLRRVLTPVLAPAE